MVAVCCYIKRLLCCRISRSISGAVVLATGAPTEEDSAENRENDELHCLSFRAFYCTIIIELVTVVPRAGFEPALQRF